MSIAVGRSDSIEATYNAEVYRRIRADIIACRLMPDERLRGEALRERYGFGGSPIREALMRLQAEGLVELEQNKGFRVSHASRETLLDLMRTRVEIEGIALKWSMENGGFEWEADLIAAFHRLSSQKKLDPTTGSINQEWSRQHRAFHAALVAACDSPTLLAIRAGLFDQVERYVVLSIKSKQPPRNDIAEHQQLMRAALDRDIVSALELNRVHIERTVKKALKALANARGAVSRRQSVS